jgi:hypothetical protein
VNGYKILLIAVVAGILLIGGALPALADMTQPAADTAGMAADERIATETSVSVGYRSTSVHGEPGRAGEYESLESSPTFNVKLFTDPGKFHLDLDANYLNDEDYAVKAHLDTKGLLRLDLRSERFFHNLDHIPYDNGYTGDPGARIQTGPAAEGSRPDAFIKTSPRAYYTDQNPGDDYGLRLDINEVKLKIKCPDYPAHVNLSYWRYEKKGEKQLRFASEGGTSGSCNGCHMQSKTRDIDRVTEEVKISADAHAGFIDVVLEGLYRTFRDGESIPSDIFGQHDRGRTYGAYEHDEDPDSRVKEATLRLNTAPSGGLVGSASFTIGERENRSDLASVGPIDAKIDYTKTAADVTYTPNQHWTMNLRYRLLDMDSDNSDVLYDNPEGAFTSPLPVRDSMDITRAWYEAVVNYRPSPRLSLKAEVRVEDIDRSDTGEEAHPFHSSTPPALHEPSENWQLPDEEIIIRGKLGFTSRHLEKSALKISGWLAVQTNDDPAYGTSFENSQELFLSANYTPSPFWGLLASLNLLKQENNDFAINGLSITLPSTYEFAGETTLDRDKDQQNLSIGTWLTPREGLSFDLNYGYLRTAIDQDILFGRVILNGSDYRIENESVDYRQNVQTITLGATWQPLDRLSCRFEGYHIRSKASFDPDFPDQSFLYYFTPPLETASSADLREISKVDISQNGLRGRVNWQFDDHWSCAVEATFDDYDEHDSDVFDGSVQTTMVSFTRAW